MAAPAGFVDPLTAEGLASSTAGHATAHQPSGTKPPARPSNAAKPCPPELLAAYRQQYSFAACGGAWYPGPQAAPSQPSCPDRVCGDDLHAGERASGSGFKRQRVDEQGAYQAKSYKILLDLARRLDVQARQLPMQHSLTCHVSSTCGWRPYQEDAWSLHTLTRGEGPAPGLACLGVFDGHGGSEVARFCAANMASEVQRAGAFARGDLAAACRDAFLSMDQRICREDSMPQLLVLAHHDPWLPAYGRRAPGGPYIGPETGTTATVALLDAAAGVVTVASAGDSRAMLGNCRGPVALTNDHKATDPAEQARICKAGAWVSRSGRVCGELDMSRALGDAEFKQAPGLPPHQQAVSALPDVARCALAPDDLYLLLGTDGLFNVMGTSEVHAFVMQRLCTGTCPELICQQLCIEACLSERTAYDNVTVMMVLLQPPPLQPPLQLSLQPCGQLQQCAPLGQEQSQQRACVPLDVGQGQAAACGQSERVSWCRWSADDDVFGVGSSGASSARCCNDGGAGSAENSASSHSSSGTDSDPMITRESGNGSGGCGSSHGRAGGVDGGQPPPRASSGVLGGRLTRAGGQLGSGPGVAGAGTAALEFALEPSGEENECSAAPSWVCVVRGSGAGAPGRGQQSPVGAAATEPAVEQQCAQVAV